MAQIVKKGSFFLCHAILTHDPLVTFSLVCSLILISINCGEDEAAVFDDPVENGLPAKPSSMVMKVIGDEKLTLEWGLATRAESYKIYKDGELDFEGVKPDESLPEPPDTDSPVERLTAMSYTITGLINGKEYIFQVSGVNDKGEGEKSDMVMGTPVPPIPLSPGNLQQTAGDGQISLTWDAVAEATSYQIVRDGADLVEVDKGETSYTDTNVMNGKRYEYQIKTVVTYGSCGEGCTVDNKKSSPSNVVEVVPLPPAPDTPQNLKSTSRSASSIALSWDAVAGVTSYQVLRDNVNLVKVIGNPLPTAHIDDTVTRGLSYSYTVRAVIEFPVGCDICEVEGTLSKPVSVTAADEIVGTPQGLTATPGDGQVSLTWTAFTTAVSYRVYRDDLRVGVDVDITGTSYTDTGLTNGIAYEYTVSAVDDIDEESEKSAAIQGIPLPPAPGTPAGLTATAGDKQVTLNWRVVQGASHYRVERGGSQVGGNVNGTSYTDTGLTNGTLYNYKVRAVKTIPTSGCTTCEVVSQWSAVANSRPLPPPPAAPSATAAVGDSRVALSWESVANVTYYRIYREGI